MEGVVFADGSDVIVTPSEFKVKGTRYRLPGIVRHGIAVIRPFRLAGLLVSLLGAAFILFGIVCLIVPPAHAHAVIGGVAIDAGHLCLWIGMSVVAVGLMLTVVVRELYAVRIATATGEINAVISRSRDYVVQIVNALNRAFRLGNVTTSQMSRTIYL